jgi:NAD(P)-dependent dehydrogenase (short-subunit alcohol dehydrogenase family)
MSKVALVTGGSRGIGNAIALDLLKKGYYVGIGYHKNKALAHEIAEKNSQAMPLKIDVSSVESIQKAFNEIENNFGTIDVLVNNAGISQVKAFELLQDEDWQTMWETNFMSAVRCIKLALPAMIKKGGGKIINIASIGGQWGGIHQIHYAASKAALINLTKSIAKSYSKEGICCNAVSPGLIHTDMISDELKKSNTSNLKNIPIGRHGTVHEVSSLVGYLCSEESSYITGQVLNVNGGMNLCE